MESFTHGKLGFQFNNAEEFKKRESSVSNSRLELMKRLQAVVRGRYMEEAFIYFQNFETIYHTLVAEWLARTTLLNNSFQ